MKMRIYLTAPLLALAAQTGSAFDYPPLKILERAARAHARNDQAWVEFSNEDRVDYYLVVKPESSRLRIYRENHKGAVRIPSGHSVSVVVSADEHWRLSGDTGQELPLPTSRGRATEVTLSPAIRSGKVGANATVYDGRRSHSVLMFSHWARPVINHGPNGPKPGGPGHAPAPAPKPGPGKNNHAPGPGKGGPSSPIPPPSGPGKPGSGSAVKNPPAPQGPGGNAPENRTIRARTRRRGGKGVLRQADNDKRTGRAASGPLSLY